MSNNLLKSIPINNFTYQDEIMNFSFILDDKIKIDINELSQLINMELIAKDPKNDIRENFVFKNAYNIIKIKDKR